MSCKIRPMKKGDIPQVSIIEGLSFLTPWSQRALEEELHNSLAVYFVMEEEEEGKILGYAGFWKVSGEGHINNIAVHPDFRRQGVGHKLLTALEEEAEKEHITVLFLEVREHNEEAQRLYRNHGFHMVGLRKDYYTDSKEDAIIMEKILEEKKGTL